MAGEPGPGYGQWELAPAPAPSGACGRLLPGSDGVVGGCTAVDLETQENPSASTGLLPPRVSCSSLA